MCGIAGVIMAEKGRADKATTVAMANVLAHRGPDGAGYWQDEAERIFFAHRRLSIIDLSPASGQPFHYGDYVVLFNGAIYNYRELKQELAAKGYAFRTTGDTEVIAAAWDCWGNECLHRFDGMFAIAMLHKPSGKMLLARDRFGEKPLYFYARYAALGKLDMLLFASEMKALWAAGVPREVQPFMVLNYLTLGYVQNPIVKTDTFFKHIMSLPPGYLLETDTKAMKFTMKRWYEPYKVIRHLPLTGADAADAAAETLHQLLLKAVDMRLRSDVPVGTSLSGGLDSSCIVAAIDALKQKGNAPEGWANVCFSAIFPGFAKDEDVWSAQVANTFGISRYVVSPQPEDLLSSFDKMMYHQEEPVQSSSVFTQYTVYGKAAEEAAVVMLDGQGADEVLAGYPRYSHWYLQQMLRSDCKGMRREKQLLQANGMLETWGIANYAAAWLPVQTAKLLQLKALRQQKQSPVHPHFFALHRDDNTLFKPVVRNLDDMLYFNTFNFGLEELLRYADRNSMAFGREVRLPFLQHQLVEFVFSLPANCKIRDGFGKWILRKSMDRYLGTAVAWRRGKIGFEPPQQQWMQYAPIRQQVQEAAERLVKMDIVKPGTPAQLLQPAAAHDRNSYAWRIWCIDRLYRTW